MARGARLLIALLACGCTGSEEDCLPEERAWQWPDADGDGFGAGDREWACPGAAGLSAEGGDCDDDAPDTHPAAADQCDAIDNDCDGDVDEGHPTVAWFPDADADGWGVEGAPTYACGEPEGSWATQVGDCDDTVASTNPDAFEVCNAGVDDDCDTLADDDDPTLDLASAPRWHRDRDADTYGDPNDQVAACTQPKDRIADAGDCDDLEPGIHPDALEVCDPLGVDQDCDGLADDADPDVDPTTQQTFQADADADGLGDPNVEIAACRMPWGATLDTSDCDDTDPAVGGAVAWLLDADGDGFAGAGSPSKPSCTPPSPDHVDAARGLDCDDTDPDRSPGLSEACNGIDDDCDTLVDDDDDWVLPASATATWIDGDGDSYGGGQADYFCTPPGGVVFAGGDCDDAAPGISPDGTEVCGGADEDCDGLVDDDDPSVDPSTFLDLWPDLDADGFGDAAGAMTQACVVQPTTADNPDDCDDSDPLFGPPEPWYADTDGDGAGVPPQIGPPSCASTAPGTVPSHNGLDCQPDDPAISPLVVEICMDGPDQDCDGTDTCDTCAEWLAGDPAAPDGPYLLDAGFGPPRPVWCDMTTDGGGWTLVGSANSGLEDQAGPYHGDLATLEPPSNDDDIWDDLRGILPSLTDVRVACKEVVTDASMTVDLSFYDVPWYDEITTGTDEDSCFNEDDGAGYDPAPARQDNLTGAYLPAGDDWDTDGYLEGEDTCGDEADFTVDFDDRGMDSDEADGTDWGEDDNVMKCGAGTGEAFFLFVREPTP